MNLRVMGNKKEESEKEKMENLVNSSPLILVLVFLCDRLCVPDEGCGFLCRRKLQYRKRLKVPPIIIGLTIVAMGTSLPETAVSVTASLVNNNELAVSNVVGSNIFNLMVVVGVCSILTPILVQKETIGEGYSVFHDLCAPSSGAWDPGSKEIRSE